MRKVRWTAGLLLAFAAIAIADWGFARGEITVYPARCNSQVTENQCRDHQATMRPTTYRVFVEQQTVVYWTEGLPAARLNNCAVANRRNWSCKYEDGSAELGFGNGQFFWVPTSADNPEWPLHENVYYPGYVQYLLLALVGK